MATRTTDYNDVRSSLRRHWDTLCIIFDNTVTDYFVGRTEVQAGGAAGSGDAGAPAGYGQNKDDAMTSLNKGGFFSRDFPYVVTSVGVGLVGYPRLGTAAGAVTNTSTDVLGTAATGYLASVIALTEQLWNSWASFTEVEYSEDGDKCSKFLGPICLLPGAFGTDNGELPSNGVPMLGAEIKLRRGIIVPNGGPNATRNPIFKFLTKDVIYVPIDPAFAAPVAHARCLLDVRVVFCGYLAKNDDTGTPIDEDGGTEKAIADNGGV